MKAEIATGERLKILGRFEVYDSNGVSGSVSAKKAQQLVALLAIRNGRPVSRTELGALLWPDSAPEVARANLRRTLTSIRAEAPCLSRALKTEGQDWISFDASECSVDALEFESLSNQAPWEAIRAYGGAFLAGHDSEWIEGIRRPLWEKYLDVLEQAPESLDGHDWIRRLRAAHEEEPYRETLVQRLMIALARSGDAGGAKRVYERFESRMQKELSTEPSTKTRDLARELTRIESATLPPNNLPSAGHPLVGRQTELAEAQALLATCRVLTVTGSGGAGKTTLAIELGRRLLRAFARGVWFVELASLRDPALAPQAVLSALRLRDFPGQSPTVQILNDLRDKEILLILDNCEHMAQACATLSAEIVRHCPQVKILATSRELLGIREEVSFRVPPMSLPPEGAHTLESVEGSEAVQLFVRRVQAQVPGFGLDARNCRPIASICRRLDGMPLALELAAVRARSASLPELDQLLANRFRVLAGGDRTAPPRQRSLLALIDWSYELLEERERILWARLSVFASGCALASVIAVCSDEVVPADEVSEILDSLVTKSIVTADIGGIRARYRLLETLREYAAEKLRMRDELERIQCRHRDHFMEVAEAARAKMTGPEQTDLVEALGEDQDNFRQALAFCHLNPGSAEPGLRIATALQRWYWYSGLSQEGLTQISAQLENNRYQAPTRARAAALSSASWLACWQGDPSTGLRLGEEALAIWLQLNDREGVGRMLRDLGQIAHLMGDYARAEERFSEGIAICRQIGDSRDLAIAYSQLGNLMLSGGRREESRTWIELAIEIDLEIEDRFGEAVDRLLLGILAQESGDLNNAKRHYGASLEIIRTHRFRSQVGPIMGVTALAAMAEGDFHAARGMLIEAATSVQGSGNVRQFGVCLEQCARWMGFQRRYEEAVTLWNAAEALRDAACLAMPPLVHHQRSELIEECRSQLGPAIFQSVGSRGRSMSPQRALAFALAALETVTPP